MNISKLIEELNDKIERIPLFKPQKVQKVLFLKNKPRKSYKDVLIFTPEDVVGTI